LYLFEWRSEVSGVCWRRGKVFEVSSLRRLNATTKLSPFLDEMLVLKKCKVILLVKGVIRF
jgi:hypothetical protein